MASWGRRGGGGRGQIGNHFFEFAFKLYELKKLIKISKKFITAEYRIVQ